MTTLLPTTVIGSYPQPDWLVDREKLRGSLPPRVRAKELWRVAEPHLAAVDNPAMVPGRAGGTNAVPRIVGPVRRARPVEVED